MKEVILLDTGRYGNSFSPYTIKAWKNLDEDAKSKPYTESFKKYINNFIRPPENLLFVIGDRYGILPQIRVSFSDLSEHRFHHNFNCRPSHLLGILNVLYVLKLSSKFYPPPLMRAIPPFNVFIVFVLRFFTLLIFPMYF